MNSDQSSPDLFGIERNLLVAEEEREVRGRGRQQSRWIHSMVGDEQRHRGRHE